MNHPYVSFTSRCRLRLTPSSVARVALPALLALIAQLSINVSALQAADAPDAGLEAIRGALQSKSYDAAVKAADKYLADKPKQGDAALYLKATAQYHAKQYDACATTAGIVMAKHQKSKWFHKAVFLKGDALSMQRKFKEAEALFEVEAHRLLASERKKEIANIVVRYADALAKKPDENDPGAPKPNYTKAYQIYGKALSLEIDAELRGEILYKRAYAIQQAKNHAQAINGFQLYLNEFDPDWGAATGLAQPGAKKKPIGPHRFFARYRLAKSQIMSNQFANGRRTLEDLLALLAKHAPEVDIAKLGDKAPTEPGGKSMATLWGDVHWFIVRSYNMPSTAGHELEQAVKASNTFLTKYRDHAYAVVAAWQLGGLYQRHGRLDDAIAAFQRFIEGKNYELPAGEAALKKSVRLNKSPAQLQDEWRKQAVYLIGSIRFQQRKYAEAIKVWEQYVAQFPNGPQWADSQRAIISSEFHIALESVAAKKYDEARKQFATFLGKHPLDNRARQVLFTLGQMRYIEAKEYDDIPDAEKRDADKIKQSYLHAIAEWSKLISKYPNTDEAGLALYRTGVIYEEKLGDLTQALASYRKLTWGSYASRARARITVMTKPHLELTTERKFRTNENASVKLNVRNIEKLSVRQYFLDLEAYFRKTHGTGSVENLDIALIQPDKQWELKIDKYAKYKPIEQQIEIPFKTKAGKDLAAKQGGVCIINISNDDLEATTLVVRSDLDLITKTSRRELLVYVQNMITNQPAENVELLVSDGKAVFATGKTGDDGVFRKKFDELKHCGSVNVFAKMNGNIASNALALDGMGVSNGLSAKGYIYTDRSAYQPGHTVSLRGIIRDIKDGQYAVPEDATYVVSVTDSQGRLLRQESLKLSAFGTFHTEMLLDKAASVGSYTVTARHKEKETVAYSGTFIVQKYQLEKMHVALEFDRKVYFRGETIKATVSAEYYWGEPVSKRIVRVELPNGRLHLGATDAKGRLEFEFDTTPMQVGRTLPFKVSLEGENVQTQAVAWLAKLGFSASLKPSRSLALAGEPVDVNVKTVTPDGEPTGREMTLFVLRRRVSKPNPVLTGVPWIGWSGQPAGEVTVSEHKVKTDAKTGEGKVQLKLEEGGQYVLRLSGQDRFENTVTTTSRLAVSDEKDNVKLRLFAKSDSLKVGEDVNVRLHSRIKKGIALVTFEGEHILSHRLVNLKDGFNDLKFAVDHANYPNFNLAVTVMDGNELRNVQKPFRVERQLNVVIEPNQKVYVPGEDAKVTITVTDQLGKPVEAELSLALVDQALFNVFPDRTPRILQFFQAGAFRHAAFRVGSTCGFAYKGVTRGVVKELVEEQARLVAAQRELRDLGELRQTIRAQTAGQGMSQHFAGYVANIELNNDMDQVDGLMPNDSERNTFQITNGPGQLSTGGFVSGQQAAASINTNGSGFEGQQSGARVVRREMPAAGHWIPSIVTDAKGKAVATVPMPANTTKWRFTARGVSMKTLVGDATAEAVTRKDFFVDLKSPASLREGDKPRVIARVHNLTDFAGDVKLTLTIRSGNRNYGSFTKTVKVEEHIGAEVVFEPFTAPAAGELTFELSAEAGERRDEMARVAEVRPWGLEFADHGGGVATSSAAVSVELPKGQEYTSRWLTVSVGPSMMLAIFDMATNQASPINRHAGGLVPPMPRGPGGGPVGGELLGVVHAMEYAKSVQAPPKTYEQLVERARTLVASLVVSQSKQGAWSWQGVSSDADWAVSSTSYWALVRAKAAGIKVNDATLSKAKSYLLQVLTQISSTDTDARSVVVHALSTGKSVDFTHVNALHRERNRLSPIALGYTVLAFANLDRNALAAEVLAVLETKIKRLTNLKTKLAYWAGEGKHTWLNEQVETTAVALMAYNRVNPASAAAREAAAWLMAQRGCFGFNPAKARGPAIAALALHHGKGKAAGEDYQVTIRVNGKAIQTIQRKAANGTVLVQVPRDALKPGANMVNFDMKGAGQFAYGATLRGFSSEMKDPNSFRYPYVQGRYYRHSTLLYNGKPIRATSTSPVKNLEIGQRTLVTLSLYSYNRGRYMVLEEFLPAGAKLVEGTLKGQFRHVEYHDDRIVMYFPPNRSVSSVNYELVGYASGEYRVPPSVIRDAMKPNEMRLGKVAQMTVLTPGQKSPDPYVINDGERYTLGTAYFNDGLYREALTYLPQLFDRQSRYSERDVARMLLWIHTSAGFYDAQRVVGTFEVLRRRYPELTIPFDKILTIGKAYRDIGEFERSMLVFKATITNSFVNDSTISAVLQDEGELIGSIDYQNSLWYHYPDTADLRGSHFAMAQLLYEKAPEADKLNATKRPFHFKFNVADSGSGEKVNGANGANGVNGGKKLTKVDLYKRSVDMLSSFLTFYPEDPLSDDAAFSMANVLLDLKAYETVISLSGRFKDRYTKSEFVSAFQYMVALGHFWKRNYDPALKAAEVVANGESKDRDFAQYILGQIYHAEGKPSDAIKWYRKVKEKYADANQAIDYFEKKSIGLEEVSVFRPGKAVELNLKYRNIKEADLQVYRVDLMKLYLREKNLSRITAVNLAGISPQLVLNEKLGDGKDYLDKEKSLKLNLKEEGAYLVICRGDDLFASGLVLVTPLEIEVQEEAASGRVRANVIDKVKGVRPAGVHVKAIGSKDQKFRSGETDLRGIFVADNLRGKATVIARTGDSRYAFYRGEDWLGAANAPKPPTRGQQPAPQSGEQLDYQYNLRLQNGIIQKGNYSKFDRQRRQQNKGVEVQKAY